MGKDKTIKRKESKSYTDENVYKPAKRKRKSKRRGISLLRFLIVVTMGVGVYFLISSSLFDINEVSIMDNEYYTDRQISHLAGGIKGHNLFKADLTGMKERLKDDPYIKDVRISRKLPDKVIIRVQERREYAAIPYKEGYAIIDDEQMVLQLASDGTGLTFIHDLEVLSAIAGENVKIKDEKALDEIINMMEAGDEKEIKFIRIEYSPITVKAYISDNLYCEGTAESIAGNIDALREILTDLHGKGIERGVIRINVGGHYSFSPNMK
ncbi:MAG: cell division protein FtsQ/DivIB [Anaerovoracaceae bacterium]|jgi:cell division protein FtsQ